MLYIFYFFYFLITEIFFFEFKFDSRICTEVKSIVASMDKKKPIPVPYILARS